MEQSLEGGTVAVFVRATMYGIYAVTFANSLRWLLLEDTSWKLRKVINWRPLAVTSIIFVFLTTDLVLTVEMLTVFVQQETLCTALCIASVSKSLFMLTRPFADKDNFEGHHRMYNNPDSRRRSRKPFAPRNASVLKHDRRYIDAGLSTKSRCE